MIGGKKHGQFVPVVLQFDIDDFHRQTVPLDDANDLVLELPFLFTELIYLLDIFLAGASQDRAGAVRLRKVDFTCDMLDELPDVLPAFRFHNHVIVDIQRVMELIIVILLAGALKCNQV
jgi:hypothetical protein